MARKICNSTVNPRYPHQHDTISILDTLIGYKLEGRDSQGNTLNINDGIEIHRGIRARRYARQLDKIYAVD